MARVIVVDDDHGMRMATRVMVEKAGHEVIEAPDGATAIRTFRENGADLVLCDLFMPGIDGLEVIRTLRQESPDVKIIAMSGGAFGGTVDLLSVARRLGATEVVSKPFSWHTIVDALQRALEQPPPES